MYIYKTFRFRWAWVAGTLWLSAIIVFNSQVYFQNGITPVFLLEKGALVESAIWYTSFRFHVAASCVVLLLGMAIMLDSNLRFRRLHAVLGNLYVCLVLWIAVPTGMILAPFAKGGTASAIGFFINGGLLWTTTWLGYQAIKRRDISAHIDWMVRSYALCLSAVYFRVIQFALSRLGASNSSAYVAAVWLSLLASFAVSEFCLRRRNSKSQGQRRSILYPIKEIQT